MNCEDANDEKNIKKFKFYINLGIEYIFYLWFILYTI